jgi:hypothetical protein
MARKKKVTHDLLAHINADAVVAVGFDEAYVGYLRRAKKPSIAIYDYMACVEILIRDEEYSRSEAIGFMENFILEHNAGNSTPGFALWKEEYDDGEEEF